MLEAVTDSAVGKAFEWVAERVKRVSQRFAARAMLNGGDAIEAVTVEGHVTDAISRLVKEPLLGMSSKVVASRDWLSLPQTRSELTAYVVARLGKRPSLAAAALARMGETYAEVTLEAPQLAEGVVRAASEYICKCVVESPGFVSANIMEVSAELREQREQRMAKEVDPDARLLVEVATTLLDQVPQTASLLMQRVPAIFELESGTPDRKRFDVSGLVKLLLERRNVFIAGVGGAGKTTALVELGRAMLDDTALPVPLFVSAANWSRSNFSLLEYLSKLGGVLRTNIDERGISLLLASGRIAVLLNGWNEVPAALKGSAISRAEDFLAAHPGVLVACSSRRAEGPIATTLGAKVGVVEFNWERQRDLIGLALPGDMAHQLLDRFQRDAPLRLAARNPLVLSSAIRLAQAGQEIPATLFDLLEAVQPFLEMPAQRDVVLRDAPVLGFHRVYLRALARAMTAVGAVDMTFGEALQVTGTTLADLQTAKLVGAGIEPTHVLEALCDTHLVHRDGADGTVRFAHHRFLEFYAATWLLERLSEQALSDDEKSILARDVFNWPAWTESLRLAAEKLVAGPSAPRSRLVELALRVDLTLASILAGAVRMGPDEVAPFATLAGDIYKLHAVEADAARRHAMTCMALSRCALFAPELGRLVDLGDVQETLAVVHDAGGLSVHTFDGSLSERFSKWGAKQRSAFVGSLGAQAENLPFLLEVAANDSDQKVVEDAISNLAWSFPASDAAVDAWLSASDEVKASHGAFQGILYVIPVERRQEVIKEVQRLAASRGEDRLLLTLADEVPVEQRGFAVDAAKRALESAKGYREPGLVELIWAFEPESLAVIAETHLLSHHAVPDWVPEQMAKLGANERHAAFRRLLPKALEAPVGRVDAGQIGTLASAEDLTRVFERWLNEPRATPEDEDRARLLFGMIQAAATEDLVNAVLEQSVDSDVRRIRRLLEPLSSPRVLERYAAQALKEPRILPTDAVEKLVAKYWSAIESDDIPSNGAKAALCVLMAASDTTHFEDRIYEGILLEVQRGNTIVDRKPPQIPVGYGWEFERAAVACGLSIAKRLVLLLKTRDERGVLQGVLRINSTQPWRRTTFDGGLDMPARQDRLAAGLVLCQRDFELQACTDALAEHVENLLLALGDEQFTGTKNLLHRRWWHMTMLANLPTRIGQETLKKALEKSEVPRDRFCYALNSQVSQGASITDASLVAALRAKFNERLESTAWVDPQSDTTLEDLAALHFFIDCEGYSSADLDTLADAWVAKSASQAYLVARKLRAIGTPSAMRQFFRLAMQGAFGTSDEVAHAFIFSHTAPVDMVAMVLDGTLFPLLSGYHAEQAVSKKLASYLATNRATLHQVLDACAKQTSRAHRQLAVDIVTKVSEPDNRTLDYVLGYVDRAGNHREQIDLHSLTGLFQHREPVEGQPNTENLSSRACNYLRKRLFTLVSSNSPSAYVAAELLLAVEELRFRLGRPFDEPRHPDLESGLAWPAVLSEAFARHPA